MVGGITNSTDMSLSKFRAIVKDREAWYVAIHGVTKSWLFPSGGQSIGASTSVLLNEYSGLISFRVDWFDLLPVQGTLKSLL